MTEGRVAIIGAGPSGAIALETFLAEGFSDVVVFERQRVVGGTWNLDEHLGFKNESPIIGTDPDENNDEAVSIPLKILDGTSNRERVTTFSKKRSNHCASSLYPQVETNVLAELMAFSNKALPNDYLKTSLEKYEIEDTFRSHETIRNYVSQLFTDRMHLVQLNTNVEKAWQPDGPGGKWKLILSRASEKYVEYFTEYFDFLYVANGRFSVPNIPSIEGLKEAVSILPKGSVIHTKEFRDPSEYRDKTVAFVGSGFSNIDLVHLTQNAGAKLPIHLSLRSVLQVAVPGFAQPWIQAHPQVKSIKATNKGSKLTLVFADETELSDVDVLILGTGYKYSYPFLDDYVKRFGGGLTDNGGRRSKNLFWSTWWKFDASLAVSSSITDSVFWAFLERQSQATAGVWKKPRKTWPTLEEAEAWEEARLSKGLKDFHMWWPYFDELFTALAQHGNHDPGDVDRYLPLMNKGFEIKGRYWKKLADDWLETHPDDAETYNKTLGFLENRIITKIGL
uniref:Monooxygenase C n=1 Tax=Starmerella bombicola TaxID=75736 RepID=A0A0A7RH40_STABO|nr:monooxygenase C [Starmerella bombicola]